MAGLQKQIHAKKIWCEQQSELALSRCSSTDDIFMDIFFHKYIYRGLEPSDKCNAKQKNKQKKGIERLSVGLADGLQTFWWSLNVVCNKSHRCLRACWWLDSNVITERRWGSHFSSHFNFFYMLRCSSIYRDKQEKTELAWITVQCQQRPTPSCFWLVGTPYIYPKLCSGPNRKQLGGSLLISVVKKKNAPCDYYFIIVLLLSVLLRPLVVPVLCWTWNMEQQKKWRMEQLTDGMEY